MTKKKRIVISIELSGELVITPGVRVTVNTKYIFFLFFHPFLTMDKRMDSLNE